MGKVRTIVLQKGVFDDNDAEARELRDELKEKGTFLINVMSSPGAGKTTTLVSLVNRLKQNLKIGVMEADIDSDIDAVRVADKTGCKSIQLHTGGMCHLDAAMTRQGIDGLDEKLDLIFLENVGNLVCPAEFDTGAHLDAVILSVPEGDDKPLKYPLVFEKCGLVIVNKIDASDYFSFDMERCRRNVLSRNPKAAVFSVSAKTGEGMEELTDYLLKIINGKEKTECPSKTIKSSASIKARKIPTNAT